MKVIIRIGLDVHNESIARSLAPSDSTEVRRWGIVGGTHLYAPLMSLHSQGMLRSEEFRQWERNPRSCRFPHLVAGQYGKSEVIAGNH